MGYTFEENGHKHLFDGKRMTGVTTILGTIAKPALIGWSANMAVDYIKDNFPKAEDIASGKVKLSDIFDEARKAHRIKRDKAGDIGTLVHKAIEEFIKSGTEPELDEQGMKMFEHFRKWSIDNKVKFIESEKHVYSESMFLGGILDMIVEIDGQIWIADIKTGGVYPEAFAQMSAYVMMLKEMGYDKEIMGCIILGIKKDGTFEEKRCISLEDGEKVFLGALDIYRGMQKLNKLTK